MSSQHTGDIQIKKTPTNQNNQRERSFSFILPQKYSHLLLHISTVSLYFFIYIFWILFTSPFYCLSSAACREQDFGISSDFVIIQKTGMPWKPKSGKLNVILLHTMLLKLEALLVFSMKRKFVAPSDLIPFNMPNQMLAKRIWMKIFSIINHYCYYWEYTEHTMNIKGKKIIAYIYSSHFNMEASGFRTVTIFTL